jgi:hypothetical protein
LLLLLSSEEEEEALAVGGRFQDDPDPVVTSCGRYRSLEKPAAMGTARRSVPNDRIVSYLATSDCLLGLLLAWQRFFFPFGVVGTSLCQGRGSQVGCVLSIILQF